MKTSATLSADRRYRYHLIRLWGEGSRRLVVIGLNPSTADETKDDPTIRRCVAFAKREDCDGLVMLNLFAFRSTKPALLFEEEDPVGPDNDRWIRAQMRLVADHRIVVAAWGVHGSTWPDRVREVAELAGGRLQCLGVTQNGQPRHPLYVRSDARLQPWSPR